LNLRRLSLRLCACALMFLLAAAAAGQVEPVFAPVPRVATVPMPHDGDAADDPAFWLHPTDPEQSLLLGTDKQGGLHSYNLDGTPVEMVADGAQPNNVDVLYGFPLAGQRVDLAVASTRGPGRRGVMIWRIDLATRKLVALNDGRPLAVLADKDQPYGLCGYRSATTGKHYFFVNDKVGNVEQYELTARPDGTVRGQLVRNWKQASIVEGCVADDQAGRFYLAEEKVGIWEFPAEPDQPATGQLIARVGEHGLTADVEGLTLYPAAGGKGYLIASSQGSNDYKVYLREPPHTFVGTIRPAPGRHNAPAETDGIAVISAPLGKLFPQGCLAVQDGKNAGANQNFKLYGWEDIAATALLIDTSVLPRQEKWLIRPKRRS
jgi:3-phytase